MAFRTMQMWNSKAIRKYKIFIGNGIEKEKNIYTALQKFGNTPGKVWFWTISA